MCIKKDEQGDLQVVIGDFVAQPSGSTNWVPADKHVMLNQSQFLKLVALILGGFTAHYRNSNACAGNLTPMHPLGDSLFFVWSSLGGNPIANIRFYHKKATGVFQPTKQVSDFDILSAAVVVFDFPEENQKFLISESQAFVFLRS